jgi:glutathione S-transferase
MATTAARRCIRAAACPALELPDGTVITQSKAILRWVGAQ